MYPLVLLIAGLGLLLGWDHEGAFQWGGGLMFCGFVAFMEQLYWDGESKARRFMPPAAAEALLSDDRPIPEPLKGKLQSLAGRPR